MYDDVNGWQTDQFLGQGEFYLNFGNYDVSLTVPHDHIVQGTGVIVNPTEVLTATQRSRLAEAFTSETPKFIINADEVMTPGTRPAGTAPLTWHFKAENVRDFAWASSKTFVWDAAGFKYKPDQKPIEMHSLYPRDAMPLWDKVSTKAIIQTMKSYGRMAFPYPVPQGVEHSWAGVRHGVPDDRLLRRASAARRLLHAAGGACADLGDDPRGGAQLVPDDRGLR